VTATFPAYHSRLGRSQGIAVLQIKGAQCAFNPVTKSNDAVLQIAAEYCDKSIALPENSGTSNGTGTVRMIDTVLLDQKCGRIFVVPS
jgi:hypothetical protein